MPTPTPRPIPGPSLVAWATTFAPFALLLSAALLGAELDTRIVLHRAIYTIWLSAVLAGAAYVLYILNWERTPRRQQLYQYWRLLWSFAAVSYLAHFYYTFVGLYGWNVGAVFAQQTRGIALSNFIFTAWWVFDVLVLWLAPDATGWRRVAGMSFQAFSFVVFIVAFMFLRPGAPQFFGAGMIGAMMIALLFRVFRTAAAPAYP